MRKKLKKQLNKRNESSLKKGRVILLKSALAGGFIKKEDVGGKISKKKVANRTKTKNVLKNTQKIFLIKKNKKNIRKKIKQNNHILTFGNIEPERGRILLLIVAVIFSFSFLVAQNFSKEEEVYTQPRVAGIQTNRNITREKEINNLVAGYPIEKMTTYIAKQDPKVAAFLVAIAKKESAWGKRKPVLNGEDCYNYWGFRLKSDKMGSGGHTCFNSPEEAVEIVGSRLQHLVNEEEIDTPKEMVIWKCGYDCDGPEAVGSKKWIKDVDQYYKKLIN